MHFFSVWKCNVNFPSQYCSPLSFFPLFSCASTSPFIYELVCHILQEDTYNLFYANNNWYIFFRLHHKLCIRLLYYRNLSEKIAQEEASSKVDRKHSTAVALRLRSPREYWFIVICIYSNIALFVCCDGGFGGGGGCVYVRERVKDDRLLWF